MSSIVQSQPLVVLKDGKPTTTSFIVAEVFGKRHADTLRAISNLECSEEFTKRNFAFCSKISDLQNGKPQSYVEMTRDGFVFLAMGFTGKEAAAWKEKYIAAFNALEAHINSAPKTKPRQLPRQHYRILQSEVDEVAKWTAQPGRAKAAVWEHLRKIGGVENVRYFPRTKMPEALAVLANLKKRTRAFVNDSKASERVFIDTILSGVKLLSAPRQPEFKLLEAAQ